MMKRAQTITFTSDSEGHVLREMVHWILNRVIEITDYRLTYTNGHCVLFLEYNIQEDDSG